MRHHAKTPHSIVLWGVSYVRYSLNLCVVFCRSVASVARDCDAEAISSLDADCD